uniref:ARAD1D09042p n=1 Tax=Blastobotrys adeninivorans TaxID=409370 RepID=A0A060T8Q2_BLAAD
MSERSPLLQPRNIREGEAAPYFDIQPDYGFSRSPRRGSFASGSVGRHGFLSSLVAQESQEFAADLDEDESVIEPYTTEEATRLAREQQTLLDDNNISYETISDRPPELLTLGQAREEIVETQKAWNAAVATGRVHTTVRRELIVLATSALPLTVTFLLQYSLPVASIFSVGHLGTAELAAVSLASMTSNITGFAMIQGFATCLDTLCPQAFGAGHPHQVGMYFQKCVMLILACFVPIAVLWVFSEPLIAFLVSDREVAHLAALYLRTIVIGAPGYVLFECGKRFVQAQGIFHASTIILLVCAPFNAIMNYLMVWSDYIGVGFVGAPMAVVMTNWLMPLLLFLFVVFVDGKQCWNGFSQDVFKNWGPMFKLAVPGFIMIEAEFLAFEVLTFAASRFGPAVLAAQAVLATITSLTYQIPFALAIAVSTRVANFVGATLVEPAKVASRLGITCSYVVALFNALVLYIFRYQIGSLFSNDEGVIEIVGDALPICCILQLADSPAAITGGVLKGQGRQHLGGYLNIIFYYPVALPICFGMAFGLGWGLYGLWAGITIGLFGVAAGEIYFVANSNWEEIVSDARERSREERVFGHV